MYSVPICFSRFCPFLPPKIHGPSTTRPALWHQGFGALQRLRAVPAGLHASKAVPLRGGGEGPSRGCPFHPGNQYIEEVSTTSRGELHRNLRDVVGHDFDET